MGKISTKTWLITGVSSGLGHALAEAVLMQGDTVVGTSRNNADKAKFELLAPGRAHGLILDVTDEDAIPTTVAKAESIVGEIDILVNNAGYALIGAVEEASSEEIRAQFEVNVFGAIAMIQAILPSMRRRRSGHIINITSVSGLAPWAGTGIYTASKFAMEGLGQTLAEEVAALGIKVTNVEPGGLRTNFSGRSLTLAKQMLDDYDGAARESRRVYTDRTQLAPGDPKKAAQSILTIVAADDPPLQLLLGNDAKYYLEQKQDAFNKETAKWSDLTLDIAFDE